MSRLAAEAPGAAPATPIPRPPVPRKKLPEPVDAEAEARFAAWTSDQQRVIRADAQQYRVHLLAETTRAYVDEMRVYLPGPDSRWAVRVRRGEFRAALQEISAAVATLVDALLAAEVPIAPPPVPLQGRVATPGTSPLTVALDALVAGLERLTFSALAWPRRERDPAWTMRHLVLGQWNWALLQWAAETEAVARANYLELHPSLDWREPGSWERAKEAWQAHQEEERAKRTSLESMPGFHAQGERLMQQRLEHVGPGGARVFREKHTLFTPANSGLVTPPLEHWQRLYASLWWTLTLDDRGPFELSDLLVPTDGLRMSTLVGAALGYLPWVVRAAVKSPLDEDTTTSQPTHVLDAGREHRRTAVTADTWWAAPAPAVEAGPVPLEGGMAPLVRGVRKA